MIRKSHVFEIYESSKQVFEVTVMYFYFQKNFLDQ